MRDILVLACTVDRTIRTANLDAHVSPAGVDEIDLQTGVRLSSLLTGHLLGRKRQNDGAAWQSANNRLLYRRETEFE